MTDFKPFPKIPRWRGSQHCFITEKIDGTNAQVYIRPHEGNHPPPYISCEVMWNGEPWEIVCGSRSRWVTPEDDNFGFARWVWANREAIVTLGKGQHFGEWWGSGIQRTYGVREKFFSLFNTMRWGTDEQKERLSKIPNTSTVPILYTGEFSATIAKDCMDILLHAGSSAAPFMNPEGIVIYLPESRSLFKMTFDGNESKWSLPVSTTDETQTANVS